MEFVRKKKYDIGDLVHIVQILREPGGCPWDREQTHTSIRSNLIEETYEVCEAIDLADQVLLCEELGDLLLQIVLHTRMEQEAGTFNFEDVCDGICQKLIYRHPHVFEAEEQISTETVLDNWETLKNAEKGRESARDRLESVPASLPALMRSQKVQKRAGKFGFGYNGVAAALADLEDEVCELREAIETGANVDGEVGDVLFSAVNVAQKAGTDAEESLTRSCERFVSRVEKVEELAAKGYGKALGEISDAERDLLWKEAKRLALE